MTHPEAEREIGTGRTPVRWMLFAVLGGAAAWTVHFLGSYAVVAIGCVAGWPAGTITTILVIATLVLGAAAAWSTATAWRAFRRTSDASTWDQALAEPGGWFAFLMLTGILLGLTSLVTIVLEGLSGVLLPSCPRHTP